MKERVIFFLKSLIDMFDFEKLLDIISLHKSTRITI